MKRWLKTLGLSVGALLSIKAIAAVTVYVNGSPYSIPQTNERGWGSAVTSWIQGISSTTLQKNGGNFTLTADVNFGSNYGLFSPYFTSVTANPGTTGTLRLARPDSIVWRNQANDANLSLSVSTSNELLFNGNVIAGATPLTASRAVVTGGSGVLTAATTTATEIGYVNGVTSAIQTQLDGKEPSITTLPIAKGGTNSGSALNNNRLMVSSGSAIVEHSAQTAANVSYYDANGLPTGETALSYNATTNVLTLDTSLHKTSLQIEDSDAGTNKVTIQANTALASDYTLTLPTDDGAANQVLGTNGSGVLSWVDATSGYSANSDTTLSASDTIAIGTGNADRLQHWRVQGGSGAVTLANAPFGSTDPQDRTIICLIGLSDTNTVTIAVNDAANGVVGNGSVVLGAYESACFRYLQTEDRYVIESRSN